MKQDFSQKTGKCLYICKLLNFRKCERALFRPLDDSTLSLRKRGNVNMESGWESFASPTDFHTINDLSLAKLKLLQDIRT